MSAAMVTSRRRRRGLRVARSLGDTKLLAAVVVLLAIGVTAEAAAPADNWLSDLVVGVVVATVGLAVVRRHVRDQIGWLLAAAAVAWFIGTLAGASGWLGSQ